MRREMRAANAKTEPQVTPAQQRLLKKIQLEEQLQKLDAEQHRAEQQQGRTEPEKRRIQNMYHARRERLLEELEKYL